MFNLGRNLFLLWQGQLVSQLGTHSFNIARVYWLVETVQKGFYVGTLLMICSLLITIFSPIGGYCADAYSRKKIVVISDLVCGLAMLILSYILFVSESIIIKTVALFFTSFLASIANSFFTPAVQASIPLMVKKSQVPAANSLMSSSYQVGQVFGQGLGGTLIALLGVPVMVLINGGSFIFSALSEMFIDFKHNVEIKEINKNQDLSAIKKIFNSIKEGYKEIKNNTEAKLLIIFTALDSFLLIPLFVITPYLAKDVYKAGANVYGYLVGLFSLGMILGFLIAPKVAKNTKEYSSFFKVLFWFKGICLISIGLTNHILVGLIAFFLIGLSASIIGNQIRSFIQLTTRNEVLGRVMGLMNGLNNILVPISFGIAGFLLDIPGISVTEQFLAYGVISVLLTIWFFTRGLASEEMWDKL